MAHYSESGAGVGVNGGAALSSGLHLRSTGVAVDESSDHAADLTRPPSDRVSFMIAKSFGRLLLIPEPCGLRMRYIPNVNGELNVTGPGFCERVIPLDAIGDLWATARAFLYGLEALDDNIIIKTEDDAVLIKLYRDKPKGAQGSLNGDEVCWLRIVSGTTEEERRRIKLGGRDLLSLELACNSVLTLSASPLYSAFSAVSDQAAMTKAQNGGGKATKSASTGKRAAAQ